MFSITPKYERLIPISTLPMQQYHTNQTLTVHMKNFKYKKMESKGIDRITELSMSDEKYLIF